MNIFLTLILTAFIVVVKAENLLRKAEVATTKNEALPQLSKASIFSGAVEAVAMSSTGEHIYAIQSGNVLVSKDYGSYYAIANLPTVSVSTKSVKWLKEGTNNGLQLLGITTSPKGDYVYVKANYNGIFIVFKSSNFGETFSYVYGPHDDITFASKAISTGETGKYVYAACRPLAISTDYGNTFKNFAVDFPKADAPAPYYNDVAFFDLIVSSRTSRYAYFVTGVTQALVRTANYGKTFDFFKEYYFVVALTISESGKTVYAIFQNGHTFSLKVSKNYAESFTFVSYVTVPQSFQVALTASKNGNTLFLSTYSYQGSTTITQSLDQGKTFPNTPLLVDETFGAFATDHTGSHLVVGTSGNLYTN